MLILTRHVDETVMLERDGVTLRVTVEVVRKGEHAALSVERRDGPFVALWTTVKLLTMRVGDTYDGDGWSMMLSAFRTNGAIKLGFKGLGFDIYKGG